MKQNEELFHNVFEFPPLGLADEDGLLAVGGDLSPQQLLYAYTLGIFPWYNPNEPILWWSPDPRFVLFPQKLKLTRNNKKLFKRHSYRVTYDNAFEQVISKCQKIPRKGQEGTWITDDILKAYSKLHQLGFAHSVEVWENEKLVGGLYGVSLGRSFFGESMFSEVSGASKVGFIHLVKNLELQGFELIDCQVYTPYLESFGAEMIPRDDFVSRITNSFEKGTLTGNWDKIKKAVITL